MSQLMARGVVHVDATAFFNNYTDLIVAVGYLSASHYRTDNISNARARAELSAAWRISSSFDRVAHTFL
jgi:hypothetical protein